MSFLRRILFLAFAPCALLPACNRGNNAASPKTNARTCDTAKLKAAVNDYLRTHEKYYKLIDSIRYDLEPLNTTWILSDQASYYTTISNTIDRQNTVQYVIPPGSNARPPEPPHNRYYDSAAIYRHRARLAGANDWLGYRVLVYYRLSDVMLTYSDFTPYLFYFDTAYHRLNKSGYLHYTNIPVDPPNMSGVYFDTPYPYTPSQ